MDYIIVNEMNASSYYLEITILRLLGYILNLENLQQLQCPLIVAKLQKLLLVNQLPEVLHSRISGLSVHWNLNPLKGWLWQQIEGETDGQQENQAILLDSPGI